MLFRSALLLALVTMTFARPNPSSLKTIASAGSKTSAIKSPSQKLAEKNSSPSVASIVELPVQGVSQAESLSVQGQDSDALQYSHKVVPTIVNDQHVNVNSVADAFVESQRKPVIIETPVIAVPVEKPVISETILTSVVSPHVATEVLASSSSIVQNEAVKASVYSNLPVSHDVAAPEISHTPIAKETFVHNPTHVVAETPVLVAAQAAVEKPFETPVISESHSPVISVEKVVEHEKPIAALASQPETVVIAHHPIAIEYPAIAETKPLVSEAVMPSIQSNPTSPVVEPIVLEPSTHNAPIIPSIDKEVSSNNNFKIK